MNVALFDQFQSPKMLGIPLILIAMLLPTLLSTNQERLIPNRLVLMQVWVKMSFTKHLLTPLNTTAHQWAAPLLTIMYFLVLMNLLGLLPYTFTPTTQLALNMGLALPMWLTTVLIGLRRQPSKSLAHMLPTGTPTPLIPILIIIESISLLIRPLALGVRLTANLTAGHLLILLISMTTFTLLQNMLFIPILTTMLLLLLTGLEIAVAMIQAYVFILLLSLYLQENT